MKRLCIWLVLLAIFVGVPCRADEEDVAQTEEGKPSHGVLHKVLFYIPNRLFDLLDTVRLRARVGPGVAVSVRATEAVDVFVGSYGSVYVGLPGPRGRRLPKLPVGLESRTGAEVSIVDATVGLGADPDYGPTEIGLGAHILIVGVDAGIEPLEILDFLAGLLFIDLRQDDL